jgi:Glycosyl hydrolase family 26
MARFRLVTVALALVGLVGVSGSPVAATTPGPLTAAAAAVGGPIQFGAAQASYPGATKIEAIQALEDVIGRELAVVRVYARWTDTFPDATANWLKSTGHMMFLSVKTRRADGSYVPWADIAAAQPGSPLYADMVRWADSIKAYAVPVYLSFNHEPETSVSQPSGTPTEYIAAWRAFVSVFRARGVTNARFAWTTAVRNYSAAPTSSKYAPRYYPGDTWVDFLAIDAYNMYCLRRDGTFSRPWRSLEELLAPFMQFAAQHPAPGLIVAEYGTPEDPSQPLRKAQWIGQARLLFQQPAYERFRAVSYWNQLSHNFEGCDFRVTSSTAARDAFTRMGHDPYYAAG